MKVASVKKKVVLHVCPVLFSLHRLIIRHAWGVYAALLKLVVLQSVLLNGWWISTWAWIPGHVVEGGSNCLDLYQSIGFETCFFLVCGRLHLFSLRPDIAVVDMSDVFRQPSLFYHLGVRESFDMANNVILYNDTDPDTAQSLKVLAHIHLF